MLDALASAVTAPDPEFKRGTTIVTFDLHSKTPDSSDYHQPRVLSNGEQKGGVSAGCIFRQTKHSSNMLKETAPRTGFRGGVEAETVSSSLKDWPLLGLVLPFNQDL